MTKCSSLARNGTREGEVNPMHAAPPLVHFVNYIRAWASTFRVSVIDDFHRGAADNLLTLLSDSFLATARLVGRAGQANAKV
jgi:hypothetical protein